MRLTITPIGAVGASTARVAAEVVDYLEGARGDPGAALLAGGGGAAAYYADSREGPGRWLGAGAAFQRLEGAVDRDAFQRVLDGRHPLTGARLVTARGSSQRQHLATGTAARFDANGEALYSVADAARLLGLRHSDVEELIAAGSSGGDPAERGWLACVDGDDGPLVPDREISRHLELAATTVTPADVLGDEDVDELLSVGQAARVLRVTPQYVRRLCDAHLRADRDERSRRATLRCHRAGDGPLAPYRIRRGDLAEFAGRRRPPVARVGFDVTLTCEKSLGLLTMLSDGERQRRLVRAMRVANETAVAHLDRVASVARKAGSPVRTEGLLVASYFHGTSRALDPHPHHHNVVANAVVDADGDVRTLDARALYRHAPAAAALAGAAARWELRETGVGWWRRDDGVWEIAGIDERAIREFSRRRNEMDEVKAVLEERLGRSLSHGEEDTVALSTRRAKQAVDAVALVADWRRRANVVGLDIGVCFERVAEQPLAYDVLPGEQVERLFADLAHPVHGLCASTTTFDRGDALSMIADWSIVDGHGGRRKVLLPPAEVERLADRFCASALVAELAGAATSGVIRRRDGTTVSDGQNEPVFATIELLEVEDEIVRRFLDGRDSNTAHVTGPDLDPAVLGDGGVVLSDEQQRLVRAWCSSGHRTQTAVGRAGTGKTTTMKAAADVWHSAGYRVVGCAVKGEASRQLAADAGIEADTVALLLSRASAGQQVLDHRTVLIVDEASTIGSRDLLALLRLAGDAGAAVRLIGDPAQHGSVPAGGSFAHLVALGGDETPQLTEVHRLRDPGQRRRAELVRSGQIDRALDELAASGQLVLADSDAHTYAAMLDRWYEHRRRGDAHPMVHGRNRQRRLLNRLAQAVLAADGHVDLDQAVTLRDGRRLAVGDDVIARHGDRRVHPPGDSAAWLRNGTTGRVVVVTHGPSLAEDRITIHTAGGMITCDRTVFDRRRGGLDLGYAVTSYAVQGSTRDASTSAVTTTTARSELYVDITRGRDSNQLYGTRVADNGDAEAHLPQVPRELEPALRRRLARGTHGPALALDPAALVAGQARRGLTLAGMLAARRRRHTSATARAIDQTIAAVRRQARNAPPGGLRAILPARPPSPHLAARWDDLAGDVAVHIAITPHPRRRRQAVPAPLEETLGPRPDDPTDQQRWDDLADRLVALAVDIAAWQLARTRPPDSAAVGGALWLRAHLERFGRAGRLAAPDITGLHWLIVDVDAWRSTHGVDPDSPDPLGRILASRANEHSSTSSPDGSALIRASLADGASHDRTRRL